MFSEGVPEVKLSSALHWSENDKGNWIEFRHKKIFSTGFQRGRHRCLIRTTEPIPLAAGSFYFEATVSAYDNGTISIGLTQYSLHSNNGKFPGWDPGTFGLATTYNTDSGEPVKFINISNGSRDTGRQICLKKKISPGDKMGCRLDYEPNKNKKDDIKIKVDFTVNGKFVGNQLLSTFDKVGELYPTIGMNSLGAILTTKFYWNKQISF